MLVAAAVITALVVVLAVHAPTTLAMIVVGSALAFASAALGSGRSRIVLAIAIVGAAAVGNSYTDTIVILWAAAVVASDAWRNRRGLALPLALVVVLLSSAVASQLQLLQGGSDGASALLRPALLGAALLALAKPRATNDGVAAIASLAAVTAISCIWWPRTPVLSDRLQRNYAGASGSLRDFGWTASPNELGAIAALLVLAGLAIWLQGRRKVAVLIMVLASSALLASGTRGSLVALAAALAALALTWVLRSPSLPRVAALAALSLGVALLALAPLTVDGRPLLGSDSDGSSVYRWATLRALSARLAEYGPPLLGQGLVDGNQLPASRYAQGLPNIDNSYLYALLAFGALGLLAAVALMVLAMVRRRTELVGLGLVVLVAVMFLTESHAFSMNVLVVLIVVEGAVSSGTRRHALERAVPSELRHDEPTTAGESRT